MSVAKIWTCGGLSERLGVFAEQHRYRVGLLAARTGGDPDADDVLAAAVGEKGRDHRRRQRVERFPVAEESRDADQHVLQQGGRLGRVQLEKLAIGGQVGKRIHLQPALQATEDGGALVTAEVVPRPRVQQSQRVAQRLFGDLLSAGLRRRLDRMLDGGADRQPHALQVLPHRHEAVGHLGHRHHEVDQSRRDRGSRHAVVFRILRRLRHHHAAVLVDPLHAERAIAAETREDDRERAIGVRLGERPQEQVDHHLRSAGPGRFADRQMPVVHVEILVRRDHVDVVGLERHAFVDLGDPQRRHALQDLRDVALVLRREMQDDHEGHAARRVEPFEESLEGHDTAGGGADTDDGVRQVALRDGRCRRRVGDVAVDQEDALVWAARRSTDTEGYVQATRASSARATADWSCTSPKGFRSTTAPAMPSSAIVSW